MAIASEYISQEIDTNFRNQNGIITKARLPEEDSISLLPIGLSSLQSDAHYLTWQKV